VSFFNQLPRRQTICVSGESGATYEPNKEVTMSRLDTGIAKMDKGSERKVSTPLRTNTRVSMIDHKKVMEASTVKLKPKRNCYSSFEKQKSRD
jgi:hypothetical protein